MARQDVNQALLQTSFLYGANSAYIEALQAQYEKDPLSVEPGWREFFAALGDDPASVAKTARGRVMAQAQLAGDAEGRSDQRARRRLAGDGKGGRRQVARQGGGSRDESGAERGRDPPRDPRFGARAHDDPRLPHARPSVRQSRSARSRAAKGPRGAPSLDLRLPGIRLRPQDLHRSRARARICDRARNARDPAADLLRHDRLRIRPYLRSGREGLDSGARRGARQGNPVHARRASARSSASWSRPRGSRISSTSSIRAPSASASTARRR